MKIDKFLKFAVDPYYAGVLVIDKQVKTRNEHGQHEPMITLEEHEAIAEVISGRKVRPYSRKQYNPDFPMSKLLVHDCQEGAKFTGANQTNGHGNKYPKYRCRKCHRQFNREAVHTALNGVFAQFEYDETQRKDFIEALATIWREKQQDNLHQAKALQTGLERLKETKSRLVRELANAHASLKPDVQEEITKVKTQIEEAEKKVAETHGLQDDLVEFVKFGLEYTDKLKDDWWQLDQADRLQCQQLLFPSGIMFNSSQKVSTTQISPLYRLAASKKNLDVPRDSLLVELRGILCIISELSRCKHLRELLIICTPRSLTLTLPGCASPALHTKKTRHKVGFFWWSCGESHPGPSVTTLGIYKLIPFCLSELVFFG
jgi:hypothetical protein